MRLRKGHLLALVLVAIGGSYLFIRPHCGRVGYDEDALVVRDGIAFAPGLNSPYSGPIFSTFCGEECDGYIFCGPVEHIGTYVNGKRHGVFYVYDTGGNIKNKPSFTHGKLTQTP